MKLPLACYFSAKLPEGGVENPPAETGQVFENGKKNNYTREISRSKLHVWKFTLVLGLFPVLQMLQILWSTP